MVEVELLGLDALGAVLHDVGPGIVGVEVGGPLLHILVLLAYRLLLQVVGLAATTMGSKQSEIGPVPCHLKAERNNVSLQIKHGITLWTRILMGDPWPTSILQWMNGPAQQSHPNKAHTK